MGNKRVSQLVELTAAQVSNDDLFLIIDTSARESKKISVLQIGAFLNVSGSIIAISSVSADTASWAHNIVGGKVPSSSYSDISLSTVSASWASSSISSSYSLTASYAHNIPSAANSDTASFLKLTPGIFNGSASYALTASYVKNSQTSSFLIYTSGRNNGTASAAISASWAPSHSIGLVEFASHSYVSDSSNTSNVSDRTLYLLYSDGDDNGTASYAINAGSVPSILFNHRIFLPNTQSNTKAQLDKVNITPSSGIPVYTIVESWGTLNISFTSSIKTTGSIELIAIDRNSGETYYLDSTPILFNLSPTVGDWDSPDSGSITIPYSLIGEATLTSSNYQIFVTSSTFGTSPIIQLENSRRIKFNISSYSDIVSNESSEPVIFYITTSSLLRFTTTDGGPFEDYYAGMMSTGSNKILTIDAYSRSIEDIRYAFTLPNLTKFVCSYNRVLVDLPGFPPTLQYLSSSYCAIQSMASLSNVVSMSYLDISQNSLEELPRLPQTLSYLNCSDNYIESLPILPYGLNILSCSNNNLISIPSTFPPLLYSMSIDNNIELETPLYNLPISLSYLNCSNSPVGMIYNDGPISASTIIASNCGIGSTTFNNIISNAINSNINGGYIDISQNGVLSSTTLDDIAILQSRGWTVLYDGS